MLQGTGHRRKFSRVQQAMGRPALRLRQGMRQGTGNMRRFRRQWRAGGGPRWAAGTARASGGP
eukprot:2634386-Lingulodinium_polyedra.AAC.1